MAQGHIVMVEMPASGRWAGMLGALIVVVALRGR